MTMHLILAQSTAFSLVFPLPITVNITRPYWENRLALVVHQICITYIYSVYKKSKESDLSCVWTKWLAWQCYTQCIIADNYSCFLPQVHYSHSIVTLIFERQKNRTVFNNAVRADTLHEVFSANLWGIIWLLSHSWINNDCWMKNTFLRAGSLSFMMYTIASHGHTSLKYGLIFNLTQDSDRGVPRRWSKDASEGQVCHTRSTTVIHREKGAF